MVTLCNITLCICRYSCGHVHSVQQKSSGLKFRTSRSGGEKMYICHHNSSHFTFQYLCIRGVSLSSIHYNQSRRVYINQRHRYSRLIWRKHADKIVNFPRRKAANSASKDEYCERAVVCSSRGYRDGCTRRKQTTLVRVPLSSYFFFLYIIILTYIQLLYAVTNPLFNYTFQKLYLLHWQG